MSDKKEFTMVEEFTMWLKAGKGGQYLSGKTPDGTTLIGFINGKKKNPKEPDMRIYKRDKDGKAEKEEFTSLWVNESKNGKKYLTGKLGDKRIVGFIYEGVKPDGKKPYFSVYESDSTPKPQEQVKAEDIPF